MDRHYNVRDALRAALAKIPAWAQASTEPRVENLRNAADQRCGDIKVQKDGTTWVLDVKAVCPGVQQRRRGHSASSRHQPQRARYQTDQGGLLRGPAHLRALVNSSWRRAAGTATRA